MACKNEGCPESPKVTDWDRSTLPVSPEVTVNLHVARDPSTKQPYTLVARAGDISAERWEWADWYSLATTWTHETL